MRKVQKLLLSLYCHLNGVINLDFWEDKKCTLKISVWILFVCESHPKRKQKCVAGVLGIQIQSLNFQKVHLKKMLVAGVNTIQKLAKESLHIYFHIYVSCV